MSGQQAERSGLRFRGIVSVPTLMPDVHHTRILNAALAEFHSYLIDQGVDEARITLHVTAYTQAEDHTSIHYEVQVDESDGAGS